LSLSLVGKGGDNLFPLLHSFLLKVYEIIENLAIHGKREINLGNLHFDLHGDFGCAIAVAIMKYVAHGPYDAFTNDHLEISL